MLFGKERYYRDVIFPPQLFEEVIALFESITKPSADNPITYRSEYMAGRDDVSVSNPDIHYREKCFSSAYFRFSGQSDNMGSMFLTYDKSRLRIFLTQFSAISSVDEILLRFENKLSRSKIPLGQALKNLTVFVAHGRSRQWRDLKDHLTDHHGIKVEAYETGARAGLTIQEVLDELSSKASLALLVHTGEDVDLGGQLHARENVIHETGLFQAKLGFKRAIVLLEDGTNEFSNIAGLQQLRFKKDNIKEVFGDVLAIIRREFSLD